MRRMLALSIVLSGLAGPAFAAQDRYGPPQARDAHAPGSAATPQRFVTWDAKSPAPDYEGGKMPAPIAAWTQRRSNVAPATTVAALPTPPDRPQPLAQPARLAPAPAPTASAPAPAPSANLMPAPVRPWTDRRASAAPVRGQSEVVALSDMPIGNSVGKTASNTDDIPVTQTKQNAAATKNSSVGF